MQEEVFEDLYNFVFFCFCMLNGPANRSSSNISGNISLMGTLGLLWHCPEQAVGTSRNPPVPGTCHVHIVLDGLSGYQSEEALSAWNGNPIRNANCCPNFVDM